MISEDLSIPFNILNPTVDQDQDGLSDMYDPSVMDFDLFNHQLYKEPVLTPANKSILLSLLNKRLNDINLSKLCLAQMMLESGNFKYCYNFNYTNIKKSWKNEKNFTMYKCSEIYKGKEYHYVPPHIQCCFISLSSEEKGIEFYLKLLSNGRYKKVLHTNNAKDFVHELKVASFFTANEDLYLKVLENRFKSI